MLRVLVVDDDPGTVVYLETLLRSEGNLVRSAADGKSALEAAKELVPDVLITDLQMPGLSGNQLAAAVRGTEGLKDVYVIMLTSRGDKADKMKAFLSGANDFLVKPAQVGEILARLEVAERTIKLKRLVRDVSAGVPLPAEKATPGAVPGAMQAAPPSRTTAAPGRPLPAMPKGPQTKTPKGPRPAAPAAPATPPAEGRAAGGAGSAAARPGPVPAGKPEKAASLAGILARVRESIVAAGESLQKPDIATARSRCRQAQAALDEALRVLGG